MTEEYHSRVVVGVASTLAGLRALRLAVATARLSGAAVHAVRAYKPSIFLDEADARERAAKAAIARSFGDAIGGGPPDVDLVPVALSGRPDRALVGYASRDTDLLIVGVSRRCWCRRLRLARRCVARYCIQHSVCPVQLVPPDAFARTMLRPGLNRRLDAALEALTRLPDEP